MSGSMSALVEEERGVVTEVELTKQHCCQNKSMSCRVEKKHTP